MIPQYTEVDVEIDTEEILEEMEVDDVIGYAVRDIGCKSIFRKMQMQHDFEKEDIEEAYGETFGNDKPLTKADINDAVVNGNFEANWFLHMVEDEDIIEYYHEVIKQGAVTHTDDIIKHIHSVATPSDKLRIMKAVFNTLDEV